MYHSRLQISQEHSKKDYIQPRHTYLVVGEFPIHGDCATQLSQLLSRTGNQVITASAYTPSVARVRLRFKSRRLWSKTVASIDQITCKPMSAIIFPEGLGLHHIDKPRWQNRRMEEWRRFLLAYRVAARSNKCAVVIDASATWLTALLMIAIYLRNPFSTKLYIGTTGPKLIKWITGKPNDRLADDLGCISDAASSRRTLKKLAEKLAHEGPTRPLLVADLRWAHLVAENLQHISHPILSNFQTKRTDTEKIRLANRIPKGQTLSVFMQHFLAKPKLSNFDDRPAEFAAWYIHAPVNRKSETPLPIPMPILASEFKGCKGTTPDQLHGRILSLASSIEYGPYNQQTNIGRSAFLTELILDLARRCEDLTFLPESLVEYFRAPVGGEDGNITRMELICFALTAREPSVNPWNSEKVADWFQETICLHAPSMKIFSTATKRRIEPAGPNPVQIFGINGDQSGLSQNTQMSVEALTLANIPNFSDDRPFNRAWEQARAKKSRLLNQPVTLHHINADRIPMQILAAGPSLHIGFLLWELEQVPQSHLLAGKMLDEIWVPSSYVQKIYANKFDCKVVNIGKGFSLPDVSASNLLEYGFNDNHYVYLMCFDSHSSVERKNPLAAVLAFIAAFPENQNVRLLIKTTPVSPAHWGDPNGQMQQIRKIARRDPRIILDERMLPFNQLLSLIKRADCVVSPHRAEGFGYIPAYAQWFGRPVIVTDYSGTRDICNTKTAFPVPYKLIKVESRETITPVENAHWADIDVEALSQTLREVHNSPVKAQIKALRGQKSLRSKYSLEMQAKRYLDRFVALGVLTE